MMDTNQTPIEQWTKVRADGLAVVCLLGGIAGGWFIRGAQRPGIAGAAKAAVVSASVNAGTSPASVAPSPARLEEMAVAQAAPLVNKLKLDPDNPDLLTSIGNIYYDTQQYPVAIGFYKRALQANPSDASVRTDLATAYWYMGDADTAIAEFNKALKYAPNNPNTLFNLGLVRWKGKADATGALADWEKLLATNPNYEGKSQVEKLMADARKR
jgi:tetratricopeptide (TPR) repeat protein